MVNPADASEREPIFKWETMKEIGSHELQHQRRLVPGKEYEIELTAGTCIRVWRSDDGQQYFCHGLTFGGKEAPVGAISPYTGEPVATILQEYFDMIPEGDCRAGDILVWRGVAPEINPHSALLTDPVMAPGKNYLDQNARVQTKNGLSPETNMTLEQLIGIYGESYDAYRQR